ncbi:MAG: hypothetical protein LBO69_06255 [Ignavibacteria bacterium]|jgi:hypothetical protein|nr:hypothetical protein [Ignavibacteria bacterium]
MKNIIYTLLLLIALGASHLLADDSMPLDKCGTFATHKITDELQDNWHSPMQTYAISPKNRFRVHYDTTGFDAVDVADRDHNGIPDYVDSVCAVFDYVYEVEVVQMGFPRPKTNYYEPNGVLYDVYLDEEVYDDNAVYGYTIPVGNLGHSYIVLDNNYSPTDSISQNGKKYQAYYTNGIAAVKVTAAHEYHHAIQFDYGMCRGSSIPEMCAVGLELLVYPEIADFHQYQNSLLSDFTRYNFGSSLSSDGYAYGTFFYNIAERYGVDALKDFWSLVKLDGERSGYRALEKLFLQYNSTLADEYYYYLQCLYHCGNNAIDGQYWAFAKSLKMPVPTISSSKPYMFSDNLAPYAMTYFRYLNNDGLVWTTADTLELIFCNADAKEMINRELHGGYSTAQCTALTSEEPIDADAVEVFPNYWLKTYSPSANMLLLQYAFVGGNVMRVASAYPAPFDRSKHTELFFPISDDVQLGQKLLLTIYDGRQTQIASADLIATTDNGHRVAKYVPLSLPIGVYTYTIMRGGTDTVGKFVIK